MPRKKRGGGASSTAKSVDPEQADRMAKHDSLLRQFDAEVDRRIYQMRHTGEQIINKQNSACKIAKLKMNITLRDKLFEDAINEAGTAAQTQPKTAETPISAAGAAPGTSGKASAGERSRGAAALSSDFVTPMQPMLPKYTSTPAVTPKFDPRTVHQAPPGSLRRPHHGEVLMSMKGSPIVNDGTRDSTASTADAAQPFDKLVSALNQLDADHLEMLDEQVAEDTKSLIAELKRQISTYL